MGVIGKQSINNSLVSVFAVLIGSINMLYIYPSFLTKAELGLIRYIIDAAILIAPFILLGASSLSVRFYPTFEDPKQGHNGFLKLLLSIACLGFLLLLLLFFLFQKQLPEEMVSYQRYILPLAFIIGLSYLFTSYVSNFKKIAIPVIFNNLLVKVGMPILVILFFTKVITIQMLCLGIVGLYSLALIGLMGYVQSLGQFFLRPQINIKKTGLKKEMLIYGMFGLLSGVGSVFATQIDKIMVTSMIDLSSNGVYSMAVFIGGVIGIPTTALNSISSPIISSSWEKNDLATIDDMYTRSSINLLAIGCLLLLGIWSSVDDLFLMMPKGEEYAAGKYVILILGLAKVIDMAMSINSIIIAHSKFFRFNLYALLFLAVFNVFANWFLIPRYQIVGAALATAMSVFLFNLMKLIFIKYKFNLQPFTQKTLILFALSFLTWFLATLLPNTGFLVLNILVRSLFILLFYGLFFLGLNLSPDVKNYLLGFWHKIAGK